MAYVLPTAIGAGAIASAYGVLYGLGGVPRIRKWYWWQVHRGWPRALIGAQAILECVAAAIVTGVGLSIVYAIGLAILDVLQ